MDATKYCALSAWGESLPPLLRACVLEAATVAEAAHGLLEAARVQPAWWRRLLPYDAETFHRYYSDSGAFCQDLTASFCESFRVSTSKTALVRRLQSDPLQVLNRLARIVTKAQNQDPFEYLFNAISAEEEADIVRFLQSPPLRFFFLIWAPCYLHYGDSPQQLFRRAMDTQKPDRKSLDQLIKLDKRILQHPQVDAWLHCEDQKLRESRQNRAGGKLGTFPREMSLTQVKQRLAGFMSKLSAGFDQKLPSSKIQTLFDVLAPLGAGDSRLLRDPSLPLIPDNFRKAVQANASVWKLTV